MSESGEAVTGDGDLSSSLRSTKAFTSKKPINVQTVDESVVVSGILNDELSPVDTVPRLVMSSDNEQVTQSTSDYMVDSELHVAREVTSNEGSPCASNPSPTVSGQLEVDFDSGNSSSEVPPVDTGIVTADGCPDGMWLAASGYFV
ncbi:hypothetical protein V6N12_030457 [Hibiscus sabdariffa]|uniref:Uncharacterized protein n=1 Tax=Hibiscus sabdariffa TaxID=183260 RepID=A0ABR2C0Z6_9ROSI